MISDAVRSLLGPESQVLDPFRIPETLNGLWKEFQARDPEVACLRMCTLNMLVMCSSPADALDLTGDLQDLARLYPGRIVTVVLDPDHEGPMLGWYHIEPIPTHPEQLGCELLVLHSPADGQPLPSLLSPLWQQGLPLFLWWRGRPPYEASWFNNMLEAAHRIIFDTKTVPPLEGLDMARVARPLARVAEMVEDRYHQELAFSDLNWGRMRIWRELIAGLFDAEDRLPLLERVGEIEIANWCQPGRPAPSLQALYIAGWLARQLDLNLVEPLGVDQEAQVARLHNSRGEPVRLVMRSHPSEAPELRGRLTRVVLSGESQGQPFYLGVEREERDVTTLMRLGLVGRPLPPHALQLTRLTGRQLMALELETFGRDQVFEGALRRAMDLAGVAPAPSASKQLVTS